MQALMDTYKTEDFIKIVQSSYSYSECLEKLGYISKSGDLINKLKEKIKSLNISISHFNSNTNKVVRTPKNIFIKILRLTKKQLENII